MCAPNAPVPPSLSWAGSSRQLRMPIAPGLTSLRYASLLRSRLTWKAYSSSSNSSLITAMSPRANAVGNEGQLKVERLLLFVNLAIQQTCLWQLTHSKRCEVVNACGAQLLCDTLK